MEVGTATVNQDNTSHVNQQQNQSNKEVCKHKHGIYIHYIAFCILEEFISPNTLSQVKMEWYTRTFRMHFSQYHYLCWQL